MAQQLAERHFGLERQQRRRRIGMGVGISVVVAGLICGVAAGVAISQIRHGDIFDSSSAGIVF